MEGAPSSGTPMWVAFLALLLCVSCHTPGTSNCADGRICRDGLVCDVAHGLCVFEDQFAVCSGLLDGTVCNFAGASGICDRDVCITDVCGDRVVGFNEACDDGNTEGGDGCSDDCRSDESCGNGFLDGNLGEECDCGDGTGPLAVGCSFANSDAPGAQCRSDCLAHCGDGEINSAEQCEVGERPDDTCVDLGFDRGNLVCELDCSYRFDQCGSIGWVPDYIDFPGRFLDLWMLSDELGYAVSDGALFALIDGEWLLQYSFAFQTARSVWASSPDDIYVHDKDQTLIHYDGAGWSTVVFPFPVTETFKKVRGSGPDDVYVIGTNGLVLHFDGNQWTESRPVDKTLVTLWAHSPDNVWVGGETGDLARFDGEEWIEHDLGSPNVITAVWSTGPDNTWCGTGTGNVYYLDEGSWELVLEGNGKILGIRGKNAADIMVDAMYEDYHFDGELWSMIIGEPGAGALTSISSLPSVDQPLTATGNTIWTYTGSAWLEVDQPGLPGTSAIAAASGRHALVTGGVLLRGGGVETFGGRGWVSVTPESALFSDLWTNKAGEIYVIDLGGGVFYFDGESWGSRVAFPAGGLGQFQVWGDGGDHFVAGSGILGQRVDGVWDTHDAPDVVFADNWGSSVSDVYAVGRADDRGAVYHFNGSVWSLSLDAEVELTGVWGSRSDDVYAVGRGGRVVHFDGAGWTDDRLPAGNSFVAIDGTADDDIFAVTASGEIWTFDGTLWSEVRSLSNDFVDVAVTESTIFLLASGKTVHALMRDQSW